MLTLFPYYKRNNITFSYWAFFLTEWKNSALIIENFGFSLYAVLLEAHGNCAKSSATDNLETAAYNTVYTVVSVTSTTVLTKPVH